HVEELLQDVAGLHAHRLRQVGDGDDLGDANHALGGARNRDLGLLLLLAGECAPLLRPLPAAREVALERAEHVRLLDDLAPLLLLRGVVATALRGRSTLARARARR